MSEGVSGVTAQGWRQKIGKRFEREPRCLIPALQYVQEEAGYLPPEAMKAVAGHLGVSEARVFGVASFYSLFHFEPRGKHTVTVCRGTACHVRGSGGLLRDLEKTLGITTGGTTRDMRFSLQTVACFGSCALAPVVVVDSKVYGRQTTASARKVLGGLSSGPAEPRKGKARKGGSKKRG